MDDFAWWSPPPNHYGTNGPVISRRCACGTLVKLPHTVHTNEAGHVREKIHCHRCGETDPVILCWGSDLEELPPMS